MKRCAYCHGGENIGRLGRCSFCDATHHAECYIENGGYCASCGRGDEEPPPPELYKPLEIPPVEVPVSSCCAVLFLLLVVAAIVRMLN